MINVNQIIRSESGILVEFLSIEDRDSFISQFPASYKVKRGTVGYMNGETYNTARMYFKNSEKVTGAENEAREKRLARFEKELSSFLKTA